MRKPASVFEQYNHQMHSHPFFFPPPEEVSEEAAKFALEAAKE